MVSDNRKLILSDSLLRRLQDSDFKNTKLVSKPGARFDTFSREIQQGRIDLAPYSTIVLLVGTNNIDNLVYSKYGPVGYKLYAKNHHAPPTPVTMDSIIQQFLALVQRIREVVPLATVIVTAVIPRKGDWKWSGTHSFTLNNVMQSWCCQQQLQGNKAIFIPSYKFFTKRGQLRQELYSGDGIHLSDKGLKVIRQAVQQAMSDTSLSSGGFWRKQPMGWGRPKRIREPRQVGNLIVYEPNEKRVRWQ